MKNFKKDFTIALVGNPNCGKTTLFNLLTKSGEPVGNRIGVTFSPKEENMRSFQGISAKIVDLPGVYSLAGSKNEEKAATDFLRNGRYDCIFNIADATNLERSLFLTLQLLSLGKPVILLLNMMDEAEKEGIRIQKETLETCLGIPVFFISAARNRGVARIFDTPNIFLKVPTQTPSQNGKNIHETAKMVVSQAIIEKNFQISLTDRIDKWLCRPYIGIPLFFAIIFAVFFLTFSGLGDFLTKLLEVGFARLFEKLYTLLISLGASESLCAFLIHGVFHGVASVLAFIPQTAILFFLIAVLEDSGYMARAAFVMDTTLRPIGLSGKAFIPFLIGFGCTVPAVMSTVTLEDEEKESVIYSLPFIPCNARLPIFLLITASFFEKHRALAAFFVYLLGIGAAVLSALLHKKADIETPPLLLELPKFRLPNLFNLTREVGRKLTEFLVRAGTVVFLSCLLIDFLGTFTPRFTIAETGSESILAAFGAFFAPIFAHIGFDDGRLIAALAAGFFAKEAIVSTIEILIPEGISAVLTPAGAFSFLVFSFLYTPCIATVSAVRKELGLKKALLVIVRCFAMAFLLAFLFYTAFRLFGDLS